MNNTILSVWDNEIGSYIVIKELNKGELDKNEHLLVFMKYIIDAKTISELFAEVEDTVSPNDVIILGEDKELLNSIDIFYCVVEGKLYAAKELKDLMEPVEKVNESLAHSFKIKWDDYYANKAKQEAIAFMHGYASRSGISRDDFLDFMVVATCHCDYENCLGYQALPKGCIDFLKYSGDSVVISNENEYLV